MSGPPSQLPSTVTDRYSIEKTIGEGGMATVYLARDTRHDREVALKVLRPELGLVLGADRFLSEIKITARLDHPHILTLIDSGAADGLLYYVLPFVRGESLRDKLNRETQLSTDDALTYTRHIGSALEYAHRHGVIHRDIKPENILIHEGEAILADFGIALAVKEAGGSRLTETGLSLGTPRYMSPEQATGDRGLDGRSDQYSLAAVLYEMLTGEPPFTGATSQAVIAKLLTEQPTRIRTVRHSVSASVDAAVAKALAKVPADRFGSVGEFIRALDVRDDGAGTGPSVSVPASKRRVRLIIGAAAGVIIAVLAGMIALNKNTRASIAPVTLRDRSQLTFSGDVLAPTMSRDGKQLAYLTRTCPTEKCSYAIKVQDVGGTEGRQIFDGATAGTAVEWSPDRRYLLFVGTIAGRWGTYLVSTLGGTPRHVTSGIAAFFADGDSLLVVGAQTPQGSDSSFTVKVTGLSGQVGGTIRLPSKGQLLLSISSFADSKHLLTGTLVDGPALFEIIDRQGNSISKMRSACICAGIASSHAVWISRAPVRPGETIVRIGVDATGQFTSRQDTVYTGRFSAFAVSSDETKLIVDDGTTETNVQFMSLADMRAGKFHDAPRIKVSSALVAMISPDGNRVLKMQSVPDGHGGTQLRLSVVPFAGGAEIPIETDGTVGGAAWADSVSVAYPTKSANGQRMTLVDVRNGAHRSNYDVSDPLLWSAGPVQNGWMSVPLGGGRIDIMQNGIKRRIPKPDWHIALTGALVSPDHSKIMYWGWNTGTSDSAGYEVVPVSGGKPVRVFTSFGEVALGAWQTDGSFVAQVWETNDAVTLTRIRPDGSTERLGTIPHVASNMSLSADLKRATITWRDSHADAFMYRMTAQ